MPRILAVTIALLFLAPSPSAADSKISDAGAAIDATPPYVEDQVAGGDHWRFETKHGPVHVWRPPGYLHESAGIVVYVHGFYTDVDEAWNDHHLAEQFLASQQNALFIVPEAPTGKHDTPTWPSLGALIRAVRKQATVKRPWGHIVVAGHSGAYRSIVRWLDYRHVDHIILIDALYGQEERFRYWLRRAKGHNANKMLVVAADTLRWAEPFVRKSRHSRTLDMIPEKFEDLDKTALRAKLLYLRSQYGHMDLVTNGTVLPVLLRTTRLQRIGGDAAPD